jgi:acetylornithine deacetylase/succinyl-diaminopimelate desuccinylase-like protein
MKTFRLFAVIALLFLLLGFVDFIGNPIVVKPEEVRNWINYLAADEMKGRANGSPEMKQAAEWLVSRFREFQLKPVLSDSSYVQNYTISQRQRTVNEKNIIGMIRGTDPGLKNEYIVLSAHFDHIGIRKGPGADSIYNGADDNAAGTCTLLGIAKTISESKLRPGRTIIFAAFSGEEMGMRGSGYFVNNCPVPVSKIYSDLNFEMTGHSEYLGKNRYYMTGCKISNLDDLISVYNRNSDWKLIDTIKVANSLFNSSDNRSFSRITTKDNLNVGIPSGTFATTGLADYIHSPGDEANLFDYDNMANLIRYFSDMVIWLSNNRTEVSFTDPSYTRLK